MGTPAARFVEGRASGRHESGHQQHATPERVYRREGSQNSALQRRLCFEEVRRVSESLLHRKVHAKEGREVSNSSLHGRNSPEGGSGGRYHAMHGRSLMAIGLSRPYNAGTERVGLSDDADIACTKRDPP